MKIFFRTDSSLKIGTGHVMRCLALADKLKEKGFNVSFICRELNGSLCYYIEQKGFEVYRLKKNVADIKKITPHSEWLEVSWETDALETIKILNKQPFVNWLVIDHYALDKRWEQQTRPYVNKMMVIDDLADREHDCDLLLDQNFYIDQYNHYKGLVPKTCKQLLGPQYALLRKEFKDERKNSRQHDGTVRRILVSFGGTDPSNETLKTLKAIQALNRSDIHVDVIVGKFHQYKQQIKKLCDQLPNCRYLCQVDNMAQLMNLADIAVGAGGSTTWERCCLGLPSIVICAAPNQEKLTEHITQTGSVINLGSSKMVSIEMIQTQLNKLLDEPRKLQMMSSKAKQLVDGNGTERTVDEMSTPHFKITIMSDKNSWINDFIPTLKKKWENSHDVNWVHCANEILKGDFAFFLGCGQLVSSKMLAFNRHNLVVHESDLPAGKGWSPLTWQILEGKNEIPVVLFEAVEKVDSGKIYLKDKMIFNGFELIDELREVQAKKTLELCTKFLDQYPKIVEQGVLQEGESSYYTRRTPINSRLNPDKTIREQFNLLRVVDNERYPAFFEIEGEKYVLKLHKNF